MAQIAGRELLQQLDVFLENRAQIPPQLFGHTPLEDIRLDIGGMIRGSDAEGEAHDSVQAGRGLIWLAPGENWQWRFELAVEIDGS